MKDLGKWQFISFISRGTALSINLIQTFVILRFLNASQWGTIQLAMSIGAIMGSYQHLGLASASTREISTAKDEKEIFKVAVTSALIRYLVSLPLALGLLIFSSATAEKYQNPELLLPLRLYSLVLLIQGVQSIFNAVIAGTKKFKKLFVYQSSIAVVSIALYIPLILAYGINGYFYALVLFNLVGSVSLGILALKPLGVKNMQLPSKSDLKKLLKDMLGISMAIYIVKIIYNNWENIGTVLAGLFVSPAALGQYNYAKQYSKKLMTVSDSVTDVNLAVFSESYEKDPGSFQKTFMTNYNKIFALTLFIAAAATYWSREVMVIALGKTEFDPAIPLILPIMFGFIFYSFINIVKSSIFIPAKYTIHMILTFVTMLGTTVLLFFVLRRPLGVIESAAISFSLGALAGFIYMTIQTKRKLGFWLITHEHILLTIQIAAFCYSYRLESLWVKVPTFILMTALYVWGVHITKFLSVREFYKLSVGRVLKK